MVSIYAMMMMVMIGNYNISTLLLMMEMGYYLLVSYLMILHLIQYHYCCSTMINELNIYEMDRTKAEHLMCTCEKEVVMILVVTSAWQLFIYLWSRSDQELVIDRSKKQKEAEK
jgi:hypothetical protein